MSRNVISGVLVILFVLLSAQFFSYRGQLEQLDARVRQQHKEMESLKNLQREVSLLKYALSVLEQDNPAAVGSQNATGQAGAEQQAIRLAEYTPSGLELDDPYLGSPDSELLIMAFLDYQCGPCRSFVQNTLPQLKSEFIEKGNVRFLLRDFPLNANRNAQKAASFAHCAGEQGAYWDAFNLLYLPESENAIAQGNFEELAAQLPGLKAKRLLRCTTSSRYETEILDDKNEGKTIGAVGAPGFFIGRLQENSSYRGVFVRGAQPFAVFRTQLHRLEEVR